MEDIIGILEDRFHENMDRHKELKWEEVLKLLDESAIKKIKYMEETGGEPDVVSYKSNIYIWDCSLASPQRRSLCYDKEARINRKKNAPQSSALEEAEKHGLDLLTEDQYLYLQSLSLIDEKTSSWILTEDSVREQGGAIFGNSHYGRVFIYHNSADSYYSNRGFRAGFKLL
ncbi:DUF4256 domain-containing protein [Helcococcus massiliensis]|uniref:DUF4256 domain-containing protein n=1 Tax=Helcococcus massiliensis TaxID=2040290 RepID=UPI00190E6B31|nr:DUF4256 domain-containing protein [Helcococcus massiliensis]